MRDNMSLDTDPQLPEAASPQVLGPVSSLCAGQSDDDHTLPAHPATRTLGVRIVFRAVPQRTRR
jgi:hypothetical protein